MGIFKNIILRVATSFSIQIFFIGLTDVWTRWKHDFWICWRFLIWTGGGFWRKNRKKHFFALYVRVQNPSEKPRFSQSRCSKLTGGYGCVLCSQVAVHRGLIIIFWWIYRFTKNCDNYFFDIAINFHVCPTDGPHHNPWQASRPEPVRFQGALGVTYKRTQKQPWGAALCVWWRCVKTVIGAIRANMTISDELENDT